MRTIFFFFLLSQLATGCLVSEKKDKGTAEIAQTGTAMAPPDTALGRCLFFGATRAFLDCAIHPSNGASLRGILEVGFLKDGEDALSRILSDRRLTGEGRYIVELDKVRKVRWTGGVAERGLPAELPARVYRGEPERGGQVLMSYVSVRILREMQWGHLHTPQRSRDFFALDEGPVIWAVPLGADPGAHPGIVAMRVLDRFGPNEAEALKKGAVIHAARDPDARHIYFGFQQPIGQSSNALPQKLTHTAEIIEE